jgi:RNA polymerase sigma-54 factor
VLSTVQQLDPVGVCARTVRECLLNQALLWPVRDTVVEEIISVHLEKLASRNYKGIARALGVTFKEVCEAAAIINKCLNPTPGAGFGIDSARTVIPDIFVNKVEDEYIVSLNDDGMPKLKLNKLYRNMLKANGTVSDTAKEYLQERLKSALWLIKSVHQRQRTIFRVMESIVSFQRDFLDFGLKHLKPLILKDVAEAIGVHESTVSRVTTNKYVQTPRGIFELKYFFSNAISNGEGTDVTAEYIRNKIKRIIESENSKKPYSDQQIVAELKESGVVLARRTATKYREALGFLSSSRRKVVY